MNEQLQSKLVEILAGIQSATKAAGDFALEQLPDIAQQYVAYGRMSATAHLIVFSVLVAAALYVFLAKGLLNKTEKNEYGHWKDGRMAASLGGGFISFLLGGIALTQVNNFLLVWFAPKVWLLKEIASLIK